MVTGAGEYVREVEARFLELEGRGFALSAQDVGRVLAWHAEGVPLRLVLAALDEADRRRRAELGSERLTLGRLTRSLEAAMKRRGERVASPVVTYAAASGAAPDEWSKMLMALGRGDASAWARTLVEAARDAGEDPWQAAEMVDRQVLDHLLTNTSLEERLAIEATLPQPELHASPETRAERRLFLLGKALRQQHEVPDLVGILLGYGHADGHGGGR